MFLIRFHFTFAAKKQKSSKVKKKNNYASLNQDENLEMIYCSISFFSCLFVASNWFLSSFSLLTRKLIPRRSFKFPLNQFLALGDKKQWTGFSFTKTFKTFFSSPYYNIQTRQYNVLTFFILPTLIWRFSMLLFLFRLLFEEMWRFSTPRTISTQNEWERAQTMTMAKRKGILLNENGRLVMKKPLLFAKLHNYKREDYTANTKKPEWQRTWWEWKGVLWKMYST